MERGRKTGKKSRTNKEKKNFELFYFWRMLTEEL